MLYKEQMELAKDDQDDQEYSEQNRVRVKIVSSFQIYRNLRKRERESLLQVLVKDSLDMDPTKKCFLTNNHHARWLSSK
jgi:hypothetical protein